MNQREQQTRSASSRNQTPACRGLVTFITAGSGQARSRLGEGWGGGWRGAMTMTPTVSKPHDPHPQSLPTRERFRDPRDQIVVIIQPLTSVRRNERSSRLHIGSIWLWNTDCLTFPCYYGSLA